jgi:hypothetical protein
MNPNIGVTTQDENAMRIADDDPDRPKDSWAVDEAASREPKVRVPTPASIAERDDDAKRSSDQKVSDNA